MARTPIFQRFRAWLWNRKRASTFVSEERELTQELERLDREQPGWDRNARVAGCIAALMAGMHRAAAGEIYGGEILREAEDAIWHDKHKKKE